MKKIGLSILLILLFLNNLTTFWNDFKIPLLNQNIFNYNNTSFYKFHEGVDYNFNYQKIYAPFDWIVKFSWKLKWYWNIIIFENNEKTDYIILAHLNEFFFKNWDSFKFWELLWISWNTWQSTWPHLHFELYKNWIIQSSHVTDFYVKSFIYKIPIFEPEIKYIDYNWGDIYMKYTWKDKNEKELKKYNDFFIQIKNYSSQLNIPEKFLIKYSIQTWLSLSELKEDIENSNYEKFWTWLYPWKIEKHIKSLDEFINCIYYKDYQDYKMNCSEYKIANNELINYIEQEKFNKVK